MLGQQKALSWAGFPSSLHVPISNPRWGRWRWPRQTPGLGHACWCHPGSHGTSPCCGQTRVICVGVAGDKSAYTVTSASCLFLSAPESPGDCVELNWHWEDWTQEKVGM